MPTAKKAESPIPAEIETNQDPWAVRVDVYVPRENGQASKFVAVNGRTYSVPCGRTVSVPAPIAEVIEHSQELIAHAEAVRDKMRNGQ